MCMKDPLVPVYWSNPNVFCASVAVKHQLPHLTQKLSQIEMVHSTNKPR